MERVSVVIPLYNHERFIEQTIDSVLGQTLTPFEIIVVDDGSTDRSAEILRGLRQAHPEIIFWSQPNQGAHQTLNAAIHRATGEFIAILNSDDLYSPQRLDACRDLMRNQPDAAAVVTAVRFVNEAGEEQESPWYQNARAYFHQVGDLSLALANANLVVSTSNLFLRRSAFSRVGYFAPLRYSHDLDFCLRLRACGEVIAFLDRPLLGYRLHAGNTISEASHRVDVERAAVLAFFLYLLWRRGSAPQDWKAYLSRFAEILRGNALSALFHYFLGFLWGPPKDALVRELVSPDRELRHYLDGAGIDWRAATQTDTLLAEASSAIEAERETTIAEQKAWIAKLEETREWLVGQNQRLEETLAQRDQLVSEQSAWIASLEEGKQWLAAHTQRLEAAIADQAAENQSLHQRLQDLASVQGAQQAWIEHLEQSLSWRIIAALNLAPNPPPKHRDSEGDG